MGDVKKKKNTVEVDPYVWTPRASAHCALGVEALLSRYAQRCSVPRGGLGWVGREDLFQEMDNLTVACGSRGRT